MKLSLPPFFARMYGCMLSWMCSSWNEFYYQRVRCSGQGVVLTIARALDGSDGGSGPVGPQIFFLEKKSKKKKESRVTSLPSPFPQKSSRILASWSPASHTEWRKRIIFADSNQAIRPQHTINPGNVMLQLAIAQWLVRPTVNLLSVTHHSICSFGYFWNVFF